MWGLWACCCAVGLLGLLAGLLLLCRLPAGLPVLPYVAPGRPPQHLSVPGAPTATHRVAQGHESETCPAGYAASIVYTTIVMLLYNVQQDIEQPFDMSGLDDVFFELADEFEEVGGGRAGASATRQRGCCCALFCLLPAGRAGQPSAARSSSGALPRLLPPTTHHPAAARRCAMKLAIAAATTAGRWTCRPPTTPAGPCPWRPA